VSHLFECFRSRGLRCTEHLVVFVTDNDLPLSRFARPSEFILNVANDRIGSSFPLQPTVSLALEVFAPLNGLKLAFEVILSWSFAPPQSLMLCRCCRQ
jgi:hypothetical protein